MEQNGALSRNEKANETRITSLTLAHGYPSPSVNNNIVNDLKPPAPACWNGRKKNSFLNGYKCDGLANNNDITVIEDDDLIPPTPSPAGQHSFINCRAQLCSSSANKTTTAKICNQLSATNYYNSEQRETEEVKMDRTTLQGCNPAVTDTDKESFVSDLVSPSCNSLTQSTTCSTSRKKYKLSRKGKLPKVLSSPLKVKHMCGSAAKSPKHEKHVPKGTQVADQKSSTPVIAPSKCVVLRSRMKRSATKGSSPLQKRLQTELPLPAKVLLGLNTYCIFFSATENVRECLTVTVMGPCIRLTSKLILLSSNLIFSCLPKSLASKSIWSDELQMLSYVITLIFVLIYAVWKSKHSVYERMIT